MDQFDYVVTIRGILLAEDQTAAEEMAAAICDQMAAAEIGISGGGVGLTGIYDIATTVGEESAWSVEGFK